MSLAHSDDMYGHPIPQDEGCRMGFASLCGFSSLERLQEWFGDWLLDLDEAGFKIYIYEVPEEFVTQLRTQDIFEFHQSELMSVNDIFDLCN